MISRQAIMRTKNIAKRPKIVTVVGLAYLLLQMSIANEEGLETFLRQKEISPRSGKTSLRLGETSVRLGETSYEIELIFHRSRGTSLELE
jgi:hypothetical protein